MKNNSKYIFFLILTVVLFVLVHLLSPRQFDWTPTFSSRDKNPFGDFVLNSMLPDLFPNQDVVNNNVTFYEASDSLLTNKNIIAIANYMTLPPEDTRALLSAIDSGSYAFISANYFRGLFPDTLGIYTNDVLLNMELQDIAVLQDTSYLRFAYGKSDREYFYKRSDINTFFSNLDSIKVKAYTIAENENGDPVTLRLPWGKGQIIINSTPLAFTNNYLLYRNHRFISQTLSYFPDREIWWTEYYQLGRLESMSPLRVILKNESLAWAYYLIIVSLLIFIIFEGKRKQRIIPIIKPLANTSLEFIRTIGNMYIQAGNHKAIAEKKINHFMDSIRSNYFLPNENHDEFITILARKSG
ncbi:MAG TPA: hypothetical protein VFW11_02655, partial [Cyclobacteriaceae bacterium]|nr:hypothetical protein [Cyclobacteriaceae bacterium]